MIRLGHYYPSAAARGARGDQPHPSSESIGRRQRRVLSSTEDRRKENREPRGPQNGKKETSQACTPTSRATAWGQANLRTLDFFGFPQGLGVINSAGRIRSRSTVQKLYIGCRIRHEGERWHHSWSQRRERQPTSHAMY
jgi:hypothetical protein